MFQVLLLMIYLAFVSLGLPDGLLGASWPSMRAQMDLPMSYMGIISTIISIGTIVSSLQSDRLTKNLGAGKVTALSVALTAFALFGFGISPSFVWLCVFAIPYGLGAGSVDAALNNYVALHYSSKHMSWLHCMWGLGASVGPYVVSFTLGQGQVWNNAYFYVGMIQVALTIGLFASLTLWRRDETVASGNHQVLSLRQIFALPGAKEVMICFFCYCGLEATTGLWVTSYMVVCHQYKQPALLVCFISGLRSGVGSMAFWPCVLTINS